MQKNESIRERNDGETSTFKFLQGVRVAPIFLLGLPFYMPTQVKQVTSYFDEIHIKTTSLSVNLTFRKYFYIKIVFMFFSYIFQY